MDYHDDVDFEKKAYIIKMVIYAVIYLTVIAALLGAFGYSFWTKKTLKGRQSLLKYECMLRMKMPTPMMVEMCADKDTMAIAINQDYFQKNQIIQIMPEPVYTSYAEGKYIFHFPAQRSGSVEQVTLIMNARDYGQTYLDISIGSDLYHISQFIYP